MLVIFIPILIVFFQKDVGTMLVFFAFIFALYREGLPTYVIFIGFWFIIVSILSCLVKQFTFLLILTGLILGINIYLERKKIL